MPRFYCGSGLHDFSHEQRCPLRTVNFDCRWWSPCPVVVCHKLAHNIFIYEVKVPKLSQINTFNTDLRKFVFRYLVFVFKLICLTGFVFYSNSFCSRVCICSLFVYYYVPKVLLSSLCRCLLPLNVWQSCGAMHVCFPF